MNILTDVKNVAKQLTASDEAVPVASLPVWMRSRRFQRSEIGGEIAKGIGIPLDHSYREMSDKREIYLPVLTGRPTTSRANENPFGER